jgi:hypothetical protein
MRKGSFGQVCSVEAQAQRQVRGTEVAIRDVVAGTDDEARASVNWGEKQTEGRCEKLSSEPGSLLQRHQLTNQAVLGGV